jgi:hypothetical protein
MEGNTVKSGWRDVTINEYYDLVGRLDECGDAEYEKQVVRIAFANGMDEDDVWNLGINEFRRLQVESLWMDEFKVSENVRYDSVTINGKKYSMDRNLQDFTVAQYLDFQTFYSRRRKDGRVLGNILACFLIPKGKKYADGYDINEVVKEINGHLDIMTANEIVFFFLKSSLISIRATVNYLNWMMRRMERKKRGTKSKEKAKAVWEEAKSSILDGLRSLTT